jgi:uncharacterized RDD family membrane protein YckC
LKADYTTRAVAGFVDLLVVIGLSRLPDVVGFLAATGYILVRDGLFAGRSLGKKLVGLRVAFADDASRPATFRESLIRNTTLAAAYLLFLVPYAGWVLGPAALAIEALVALGDERSMRVGDLLARTTVLSAGLPATEPKKDAPETGQPVTSDEDAPQGLS